MYTTCIYCHRALGTNDTIERFPVGRRLAFDSTKGRLWIICGRCRRWNLSPLEERWEAIEECERAFHDTPRRFSTDQIGLAGLPGNVDLIRIGRPKRREFAAWRYGREFWRRRVRSTIATGAKLTVSVAGALVGADVFWFFILGRGRRVVARVRDADGRRLCVTRNDLGRVELLGRDSPQGWSLTIPHHRAERIGPLGGRGRGRRHYATLNGELAMRACGRLMPAVNAWGGSEAQVTSAVSLIEESGLPEGLFRRIAGMTTPGSARGAIDAGSIFLPRMRAEVRLALEMAVHEESERRALEGELALLEEAWREAEEIASIADRLLIPERVEERLREFRRELGWRKDR